MIHYSLAEEQVNLSRYTELPKGTKPIIILGTMIKHRYDEDRLDFNKTDIDTVKIGNTVIRGVRLEPNVNSNLDLLFAQLKVISDSDLTTEFYEQTLKSFGLSSSECYGLLREGVYPVNGNCITQLTNSAFEVSRYYEILFGNHKDCQWQRFSSLTLFLLFNKS